MVLTICFIMMLRRRSLMFNVNELLDEAVKETENLDEGEIFLVKDLVVSSKLWENLVKKIGSNEPWKLYLGWDRVTQRLCCSKILKTGIQYLPVDSIQTSVQLYLASQSHSSFNPFVKEEKRACLYSVRLLESVIPIQAKIQVLWTSSPQQLNFKILNDKIITSWDL